MRYRSPADRERLLQLLTALPVVMQQLLLWQSLSPSPERFASPEPFCLDTMEAHEWLQWVFIPRMQLLLQQEQPLPQRLALTPYFEEVLADAEPLLQVLRQIDALFEETGTNL
ncbi:MAG: YqcC family protein [Enterobacteriaceae bacterium]